MARGLSREQSLAKNMKKTAASNKGNQEDLSTTARAARDAAAMQEKAAAKAAAKEALAKSGDAGAAQLEAELALAIGEISSEVNSAATKNFGSNWAMVFIVGRAARNLHGSTKASAAKVGPHSY